MNQKIERIKNHLVENKKVYIAGAVGVVIGGVIVFVLVRKAYGVPGISQKAIGIWNKQIATLITIDAPGNSGNVIQDLTTGTIYPSQNAAVKALGLNPTRLSEQLNGTAKHVSGRVFKKLIDGGASHELHAI